MDLKDLKEDQSWVIPGTRLSLSVRNQARVCLGFPAGSDGKESASMQESGVQSLGREDSPEKGMATHSSILVWRVSMDRGAWWATVHGVTKSQT